MIFPSIRKDNYIPFNHNTHLDGLFNVSGMLVTPRVSRDYRGEDGVQVLRQRDNSTSRGLVALHSLNLPADRLIQAPVDG